MQLRDYQQRAVECATEALARGGNPALALATGTGKSLIIAELARRHRERGVWVLAHVQQLVAQNAATYERWTGRGAGVVCAGLGRWDLRAGEGVTYGTLPSVVSRAAGMPPPGLIIIDEAHRVPHPAGGDSQYAGVLRRYPAAQRVAMTATPWRMDNGRIHGAGPAFWFDELAYEYTVAAAVAAGWLCPLVGVDTEVQLDTEGLSVGADYAPGEVTERQTAEWLGRVVRSVGGLAAARRHVAVYCATVAGARRAAAAFERELGWGVGVVHGGQPQPERGAVLAGFAAGRPRVLCSVDTLTTGYDLPALDCIVCLRPTLSSSLWVQMQGRGTRLHPGKKNCLVLDYAGNLQRLGGVGMYERHYRERGLVQVDSAQPTRPAAPRAARRTLPGVRTLVPLDPMTGAPAGEGAELRVRVHAVSAVALRTRRGPAPVLMVQYATTTREGARLDAAWFLNTECGDLAAARGFFQARRLAVNLPAPARIAGWQLKGARHPPEVTVRRRGRYWNVVAEHFDPTYNSGSTPA
jgi:DNA repair protein RadD